MYAITIFFLNIIVACQSARIFAYIPTPSFSHQVVFRPLWRELSLRGHHVTLLTTNPINDSSLTNLTEIDLNWSYEVMNKNIMNVVNDGGNEFKSLIQFIRLFNEIINKQMESPSVQELIANPNLKFDVVLIENLMAPPIGFAKKFDCPLVGVSSLATFEFTNGVIGVPTHPVLYPDVLLPFDKTETFVERVISVMYTMFMNVLVNVYVYPMHNQAIERYFGKGFGSVSELTDNVSLFLVNTNPIFGRPRPIVPSVIYIGGIHRIPPKPLPVWIQTVLDSTKDGFIYFSLGSNVKSKDISTKTRQVLLETFSELPYTVLWKFELDELPNKSDNIVLSKWFPQTDILRHPNLKLFITQGGLQSIEEAICEGVPMIGMPYFSDQYGNVKKMARKGFGLYLDHATITKEHLKKTIMDVINNPRYRDKVKEIAQLAQDQPIAPLEQAVWWIEYVIRHKGARHLRSPLLDIPWYQYWLLDVLVCLTAVGAIAMYICISIIRVLLRLFKNFLKPQVKQKLT